MSLLSMWAWSTAAALTKMSEAWDQRKGPHCPPDTLQCGAVLRISICCRDSVYYPSRLDLGPRSRRAHLMRYVPLAAWTHPSQTAFRSYPDWNQKLFVSGPREVAATPVFICANRDRYKCDTNEPRVRRLTRAHSYTQAKPTQPSIPFYTHTLTRATMLSTKAT